MRPRQGRARQRLPRTASASAWAKGADVLIEMDADLSHDPESSRRLLSAIEHGADLVVGSRYVPGGEIPNWSWHRRALLEVGQPLRRRGARPGRARRHVGVPRLPRRVPPAHRPRRGAGRRLRVPDRDGVPVAQRGGRVVEVPISFADRERGTSKMSGRIVVEALVLVTGWGVRDRPAPRSKAEARPGGSPRLSRPTEAPPRPAPGRATILHVDMDAFFVAVEVRRRPELAGLPVVVGGTGRRGVVAAASYEARRFGIHSAMPSSEARRLCPHAVFLPGDHGRYSEVSQDVHAIFTSVTPARRADRPRRGLPRRHRRPAPARRRRDRSPSSLRARVAEELACRARSGSRTGEDAGQAGVGGGQAEGDAGRRPARAGVVVVEPGEELAFLHPLPVQALWGVGPATLARLQRLGVVTVGDLAALPEARPRRQPRAGQRPPPPPAGQRHRRPAGRARPGAEVDRPRADLRPRPRRARPSCDRELVRMADAVAARLRAARPRRPHGHAQGALRRLPHHHPVGAPFGEPVDTGPADRGRRPGSCSPAVDPTPGVRLLGVSVSQLGPPAGHQLSFDELARRRPRGLGRGEPSGRRDPGPVRR